MADAIDIYGTAFKNGSATLLARLVGQGGADVVQADLSAVRYTVFLLDDQDPDGRTAVANHSNVALLGRPVDFRFAPARPALDRRRDRLQLPPRVGRFAPPGVQRRRPELPGRISTDAHGGQMILVRFRLNVI